MRLPHKVQELSQSDVYDLKTFLSEHFIKYIIGRYEDGDLLCITSIKIFQTNRNHPYILLFKTN